MNLHSMHDRLKLISIIFLIAGFAASGIAATDNLTEEFQDSMYWLEKPAWDDRPSYAENFSIEYTATNLIQERVTRETCTEYGNETDPETGMPECLNYENETVPGSNVPMFEIESSDSQHAYLGNGYVRTNLTIGLNELSTNTLKETTFLMSEEEYIDWFNENYYYNESNITSSEVDELQDKLFDMSASGGETRVMASQVNDLEITSLSPFRASADSTMVYRFEDFRTGSFTFSNLINVEVRTQIA